MSTNYAPYVDGAAEDDARRLEHRRPNFGILGKFFPTPNADLVSLDEQVEEIERQFRAYACAPVRSEQSQRLLDAALAQIDRQHGRAA